MKNRILLIIALLISTISFAQPSQTVRGKIYDKELVMKKGLLKLRMFQLENMN